VSTFSKWIKAQKVIEVVKEIFHRFPMSLHSDNPSFVSQMQGFLKKIFILILFVCAYNVWVISPPFPPAPPLLPLTPRYPAETILPLSLNFVEGRV
jgi:hypothetical protein